MPTADIIIYGANMAGCFAARSARALGRSVTVIDPLGWRGGLHTGGITLTDYGSQRNWWGDWQALNQTVAEVYGGAGADISYAWRFEPSRMIAALNGMLDSIGATWVYNAPLEKVAKVAGKLTSITCGGVEYVGTIFLDCTYEGDLLHMAGVANTYGRESINMFGEPLGGVGYGSQVDRSYRVVDAKGDRYDNISSGYRIPDGDGDARIQGFNFRGIWSTKSDRIPWKAPIRPDGLPYRREDFADVVHEVQTRGLTNIFAEDMWFRQPIHDTSGDTSAAAKPRPQADGKWGINQRDQYRLCWEWPNASWARRKQIMAEIYYRQAGTLYTIANDPALAGSAIQTFANQWGLCADEYQAAGSYYGQPGWAPIPYVRECRRMLGQYVMTQADFAVRGVADSVSVAQYFIDRHTMVHQGKAGLGSLKEGHRDSGGYRGTSIPMRALKPTRGQCDNLIVPVCISCTSAMWQPIRMEPLFAMLGQVSGWWAHEAIARNVSAVDLPYSALQPYLTANAAIL